MKCKICQQPVAYISDEKAVGEETLQHLDVAVMPCLEPVLDLSHSPAQQRADYALQEVHKVIDRFLKLPRWRWIARWRMRYLFSRQLEGADWACRYGLRDPWDELYTDRLSNVVELARLYGLHPVL